MGRMASPWVDWILQFGRRWGGQGEDWPSAPPILLPFTKITDTNDINNSRCHPLSGCHCHPVRSVPPAPPSNATGPVQFACRSLSLTILPLHKTNDLLLRLLLYHRHDLIMHRILNWIWLSDIYDATSPLSDFFSRGHLSAPRCFPFLVTKWLANSMDANFYIINIINFCNTLFFCNFAKI